MHRYVKVIQKRQDRPLEFLSERPRTLDEVTQQGIVYGPPRVVAGFWDLSISERAVMLQHLKCLIKRGRVRIEGQLYHLVR